MLVRSDITFSSSPVGENSLLSSTIYLFLVLPLHSFVLAAQRHPNFEVVVYQVLHAQIVEDVYQADIL